MTARDILQRLRLLGKYLVVAESVTGGLLTAEFTAEPGASEVLLAGVIAYDTELKHELLGVSKALLDSQGPVDAEVVAQMAIGLRERISGQKRFDPQKLVAIATTGVAGPTAQGSAPVGRVLIAIAQGPSANVYQHELAGSRAEIQKTAVLLGLEHLGEEIPQ